MQYNAVVEFDSVAFTDDAVDTLMHAFRDFHPAVSRSPWGYLEVTITLDAETWMGAMATAYGLTLGVVPDPLVSICVLTTEEFDARVDAVPAQRVPVE